MKKRILALCLALVLLIGLTGCSETLKNLQLRHENTFHVHADGAVDVSVLCASRDNSPKAEGEASDEEPWDISSIFSTEELAAMKAKGETVEVYQADGFNGFILTCSGIPLRELSLVSDPEDEDAQHYVFHYVFIDCSDLFEIDGRHVLFGTRPDPDAEPLLAAGAPGSLSSIPDTDGQFLRLTLKLPVKPKAHNAAYVSADGKTLTWDMEALVDVCETADISDLGDVVYAEFDLPLLSPTAIVVMITVSVLLIAAAAVLLILLRKRLAAARCETAAEGEADPEADEQQADAQPPADEQQAEAGPEGDGD